MRRTVVAVLTWSMLCAACGGGGGGGGGDGKPADPCTDLGYGPAAVDLVGDWQLTLTGIARRFTLYDNGTFVDTYAGRRFPGFWGLAADGKFTAVYSLTNECPPIGTLMTASGVSQGDDRVAGKVVSSPMAGLTGTDWAIDKVIDAQAQ